MASKCCTVLVKKLKINDSVVKMWMRRQSTWSFSFCLFLHFSQSNNIKWIFHQLTTFLRVWVVYFYLSFHQWLDVSTSCSCRRKIAFSMNGSSICFSPGSMFFVGWREGGFHWLWPYFALTLELKSHRHTQATGECDGFTLTGVMRLFLWQLKARWSRGSGCEEPE